jgi:CheY-like chemotaxis protein
MMRFAEKRKNRMSPVHLFHSSTSAKRKVLVVDDNLDAVHSMAMLLKMMGHQVQFAINGFAALEVARAFRPDLILLDIGLPDFDGHDIARQLKWEPGLERTRIVALTGQAREDVRQRALEAGCENYFVKPMDPATLESLLGEGLSAAEAASLTPREQRAAS